MERTARTALSRRTSILSAIWMLLPCLSLFAAQHSMVSRVFPFDTRDAVTASVTGRIVCAGLSVSGAVVEVEGTSLTALTDQDGGFFLDGIPLGQDYVLTVCVDGYAPGRLIGVDLNAGLLDIGDVLLSILSGPKTLSPLVPDINPAVSTVEEGGEAYRYYKVTTADALLPAPGILVKVRRQGGPFINQSDAFDLVTGRFCGVADVFGRVRIRVPSNEGVLDQERMFDVLIGDDVHAHFRLKVLPRRRDEVWKKATGLGGGIGVLGGKGSFEGIMEAERRLSYTGNNLVRDTIKRGRQARGKGGVELSGGAKIGVGAYGSIGGGGYVSADASQVFRFTPGSTDPMESQMRLFLVFGDDLVAASGPLVGLASAIAAQYEALFVASREESFEANLRAGGYVEAEGNIGLKGGQDYMIGLNAEVAFEGGIISGHRVQYLNAPAYDAPMSCQQFGAEAHLSGALQAGAFLGSDPKPSKSTAFAGAGLVASGDLSLIGKVWEKPDSSSVERLDLDTTLGFSGDLTAGVNVLGSLKGFDVSVGGDARWTQKSVMWQPNTRALAAWSHLSESGQALTPWAFGLFVQGVLESALTTPMEYTTKLYLGNHFDVGGEIGASVGILSAECSVEGSFHQGVEHVVERGRVLRLEPLVFEAYDGNLEPFIPTDSMIDQAGQWVAAASGPIGQALEQFSQVVAAVGDTVVQTAGEVANGVNATLEFGAETMESGAEVICQSAAGLAGLFGLAAAPALPQGMLQSFTLSEEDAALPPAGAVNYAYGIGGFVSFFSTNAFTGTGIVTIAYEDSEVSGLNESALQMYRLDGSNSVWRLLGGDVNAASNRVSCTVTQLGTFAVAPPLPAGDITISLSTNSVVADGLQEFTAVITNLVLNTGSSATQSWLYSVSASGVEVLNDDCSTNWTGTQLASTNAALVVNLRAPAGGLNAELAVQSVAGDAYGSTGIALSDDLPPTAPSNVVALAAQSRVNVQWAEVPDEDVASYRVYYRKNLAGPPYDGTASVEGDPSPVVATGTNWLLRGLQIDSDYYLAVSAVDKAGNESPLVTAGPVHTSEEPPTPPQGVAVLVGSDGTNQLMWALSEDDGYNDRDVIRYDILRAIKPGGDLAKVAEVPAGRSIFSEIGPSVGVGEYIAYEVVAVDTNGVPSDGTPAANSLPGGLGTDSDFDLMADDWELLYGFSPTNRLDGALDDDDDGFSNMAEFWAGTNPTNPLSFFGITDADATGPSVLRIGWDSMAGRNYRVWWTDDLMKGWPASNSLSLGSVNEWSEPAVDVSNRFYRITIDVE